MDHTKYGKIVAEKSSEGKKKTCKLLQTMSIGNKHIKSSIERVEKEKKTI